MISTYVSKKLVAKKRIQMFVFIKKVFHNGSLRFSRLASTNPLSCILMNNQACKVRSEIINVNSNEPVFYLFSIKTSKCSVAIIILIIRT